MANRIEKATSSRAQCRRCGKPIAKGEHRFGEALPSAYGEGEAMHWYHLACGACGRPNEFGPVLGPSDAELPDREWLVAAVTQGVEHPRLPRLHGAERSPSGRARCRHCKEPIENGAWRLVLHWYEEGRFSPMGFLHPACTGAYFGTTDIVDRLARLAPELPLSALEELSRALPDERPRPSTNESSGPALAKAMPEAAADTPRRRTAHE